MAKISTDALKARLQKALDLAGNTHTIDDIAAAVRAGTMQAFHNDGALVITEIVEYPRAKAINIFVACGDLNDVMSLQPTIDDFAKQHGCTSMHMRGRKGWRKALPAFGWSESMVSFERTI